jgi:hypothetical protein
VRGRRKLVTVTDVMTWAEARAAASSADAVSSITLSASFDCSDFDGPITVNNDLTFHGQGASCVTSAVEETKFFNINPGGSLVIDDIWTTGTVSARGQRGRGVLKPAD